MSNFHIGQKVVCIREKWCTFFDVGEQIPVKGVVYTIRSVTFGEKFPVLLQFEELVNPKLYRDGTAECRYNAENFRPVVERKTDISIFRAMLNKPTVRVDA